ncbi:MAG TPA: hypothetical protein ENO36_05085 [Fervidicoccus fontis]|uniref:DNA polymerase sliding clamp n=1 Tax=Fervidicoccus fontis TaxID=683846 RepID=A0A7C2UR07_9CREN|nr:MAG: hypothetical protein C0179_01850 [Fervidicoccus sp.]HEU98207.1 hypothetical protein [Fervidicoccus fontis]
MRLKFSEASVWREIIQGASKLIKEITVLAGEEGVRMRALDPSHVVLVDIFFPRDSLEEYESNGESFGLDLESFVEIIRRARKDDALILELVGDKLRVLYSGKFQREFLEPTTEPSFKDLPEPKIDLKAEIRLVPELLVESIEDVEIVSDSVTFETNNDLFRVVGESEIGFAKVEHKVGDEGIISIQSEDSQKSTYGIEFFTDLLGPVKSADVAILNFSSDMPAKLTLELPQGARLVTFVAPRTS